MSIFLWGQGVEKICYYTIITVSYSEGVVSICNLSEDREKWVLAIYLRTGSSQYSKNISGQGVVNICH